MVPFILQLGLFATPVAYGMSFIPSRFRTLYAVVNPLGPVIDGYRRAVLYGQAPQLASGDPRGLLRDRGDVGWVRALQAIGDPLCRRCLRGTIAAEHVWKRFHADRSRRQLRDKIDQLPARFRGVRRGWRWVLRDIGFHAAPGDSIGLVGVNGSGKSTLLKILCRVMYPEAGRVTAVGKGRGVDRGAIGHPP